LENRLQQIEKRLSQIRTSTFVEMLPPPAKRRKVDPKSDAHEELADAKVSAEHLTDAAAHQEVCENDSGSARAPLVRCREGSKRPKVPPALFIIENSIDLLSERNRKQERQNKCTSTQMTKDNHPSQQAKNRPGAGSQASKAGSQASKAGSISRIDDREKQSEMWRKQLKEEKKKHKHHTPYCRICHRRGFCKHALREQSQIQRRRRYQRLKELSKDMSTSSRHLHQPVLPPTQVHMRAASQSRVIQPLVQAQEQKVVVAHLPPTSTSSGGSFFSIQDPDDEIFEFESALTRRSFLEDWNCKRDLAKHREHSTGPECWVSWEDGLDSAHAPVGPATGSPAAADRVGEARAQVMNAVEDEKALPEFYGGRVGYKSRKVHGMPSTMATCMGMPVMERSQRGLLAAFLSTCSSSPMCTASQCTFKPVTSNTETAGKTSAALVSSTSSIKVGDGLAALRKAIALSMAASGEDIESQVHHHLPTFEMDHGSSHQVMAQEGVQYQLQGGKWCQKPNQMQPWAELVGERVRVYWDGEGEWFAGHVSRYCARRKQAPHFVLYDDGDAQWENFQRLRWMKDDHPSHARVQVATARILQFVFRKRSGKSIRLGPCQELIATQRQSTLALQSLFQALSIELRGLRAQHVPRDVEDIDGRQLSGKKQIGRRLRLLWAAERKWFFGTVIRFCVLVGHVIEWDDREVSVNDLSSETFKWILEEESDDDARGDDVARGSYAGMRTNSKLRTDCCISCDACPSPPTVDCPPPPRVEREQGSEEGEGDDGMDGLFFTDAGRAGRDMQQSVRVRPAMGQACVSACGAFPRAGLHRGTAICAVDATREGRKRRSSTMVEAAAAHVEKADKAMAAGLEAYGHISHALPPAPCDAAQECVSILAPPTMPAQSSSSSAVRMLPTPVARDPKQVKQVELELARLDMDEAMRLLGLVKKRVLQRKLEIFQQTHAGRASVSLFNLQTRCIKHPSVYLLRDPPPWC
jgi:hypothetical protein